MMASLYQSWSRWRSATGNSFSSMDGIRFMEPSSQTAKQQRGIAHRVDPQPNAAPLDRVSLAGDQVLDRGDVAAIAGAADLDVAERKPEFVHLARQRDGRNDRVGLIDRFLDKADDVAVIDRNEAQLAGLVQRGVFAPGTVEVADVGLDVAGLVPIPHLDLVFFGIEIFFLAGYWIVFQEFEPVVDAVGARQRSGKRDARLEHPGLAALQMVGQDVWRIDEEIRAIEIAFRISRQLVQVLLQLPLLGAPGKVGV